MFHRKLLELESERIAKELALKGLSTPPPQCDILLQSQEHEIGLQLGVSVDKAWVGWLTYRRAPNTLIICRGRAFKEEGIFGKWRAGLDVPFGLDTITEYRRGFDVTTPHDLDHLLINFGGTAQAKIFLWYGENIAAYRLIYDAEIDSASQNAVEAALQDAVIEGCKWIMLRPKNLSLEEFLEKEGL